MIIKPVTETFLMSKVPRGYRNYNYGNICKGSTSWVGEIPGTDSRFCTFSEPLYGYRALCFLLLNYLKKNYDTLEKIIQRYAPSSENNTKNYIDFVSTLTGIKSTDRIFYPVDSATYAEKLKFCSLVAAICSYENGCKNHYFYHLGNTIFTYHYFKIFN